MCSSEDLHFIFVINLHYFNYFNIAKDKPNTRAAVTCQSITALAAMWFLGEPMIVDHKILKTILNSGSFWSHSQKFNQHQNCRPPRRWNLFTTHRVPFTAPKSAEWFSRSIGGGAKSAGVRMLSSKRTSRTRMCLIKLSTVKFMACKKTRNDA